jgi:RNA polymerase subunit RPABC4/transcription elongation factor Spt4
MKHCTKCGAETPAEAKFCPGCGAEQSTKKKSVTTPGRLLVIVAIAVIAGILVVSANHRAGDKAEKNACEMIHGAGLCVKSAGHWVPIGQ